MHGDSLTSVIIIFLNAETYLQEAIDSVLEQTCADWELLLVDDGSSDASTRIASAAAKENPGKVRYLEHAGHQNRGMSASRNLGIQNSEGDYIAFLDADDVWLPGKLERQTAILEAHPEAGMVYGPALIWHSWSPDPDELDYVQPLGVHVDRVLNPPTLLSIYLQNMALSPSPSGIMVRRKLLESVGGFEERFKGLCEDQVIFAKCALASPIFVSSGCWYKYRQHPDSCCTVVAMAGQKHKALLFYFNWLKGYLVANSVSDRAIWNALKKKTWAAQHPRLRRLLDITADPKKHTKQFLKQAVRRTLPHPARVWLRCRLHL